METTINTAVNKALISAQKCVLKALKDGTNPAFKSKYATLDSVLDAVRGPLSENGFALVQDTTSTAESVSVITRLLHESGGELISQPLSAPLKKEYNREGKEFPPSVQQIGSMVTYLRRYSLCPFLGVSLDDDDDGNHISKIGKDTPEQTPKSNRVSAHTGEPLNTPEAIAKHHTAAVASADKPRATVATPKNKTEEVANVNDVVENAPLREALNTSLVRHDHLAAYLRGELGEPKIKEPILSGSMGVASLGERIVKSLLSEKNWGLVISRIKADPNYLPF